MSVIVRFAPSPTGYLHIGSARTALFNWLYARHTGGKYLLRIEDTDRKRSTQPAINAIVKGLEWLGLDWDDEPVFQFARLQRHTEVAYDLVKRDLAYKCYCSPEELEAMRENARAEKRPMKYDGTWRDRDPAEAPIGVDPVIRFKAPQTGETTINDMVQGVVTVANEQLDDMILLRADGTPTYMLSVVVDDHDMAITHIIRGDDHLNNAFRQYHLFKAMDWKVPEYAHIPLIHGEDGAKLSKRHGALGVEAYEEMGYLPEAMRNYLARLGWGHGDDEIFTTEQAIEWFDVTNIGKSPARFDFAKLNNLNGHYIREADDQRLVDLIKPRLEKMGHIITPEGEDLLLKGMPGLKQRAKTMIELADSAAFYITPLPLPVDENAHKLLDDAGLQAVSLMMTALTGLENIQWTEEALETLAREVAETNNLKLGKIAQPMRAALTGSNVSPSIFEIMSVLGREQTLQRLGQWCK